MKKSRDKTKLHFVGIGGIGMSGIAEVFHNQGYVVTGSDLNSSDRVKELQSKGIEIHIGHQETNVGDPDVVVISSAVQPENPEVVVAKKKRIPVIPRAEMLGELMRGKTGIAVAGTHGKTTTSSMLGTVMAELGYDPTIVIGGIVNSIGGNAKLGSGDYVVAEADESDGSFLYLPATYGIVTNIDSDHMDHFDRMEAVDDAFVNFVGKLPFFGMAAVCVEDPGVKRCLERWTKPYLTYGFDEGMYRAKDLRVQGLSTRFKVSIVDQGKERGLGEVVLPIPGRHNVLNAMGVIAVLDHLGADFSKVSKALGNFAGVGRRFEMIWNDEANKRMLINDYGHHPTEILATLKAAREIWGDGKIKAIFQPHRYSRTLHSREGFVSAFHECDSVFITEIFAAGEDPIPGVDSDNLVKEMKAVGTDSQTFENVGTLENAQKRAIECFEPGDLLICFGAGSISTLASKIKKEMSGQ